MRRVSVINPRPLFGVVFLLAAAPALQGCINVISGLTQGVAQSVGQAIERSNSSNTPSDLQPATSDDADVCRMATIDLEWDDRPHFKPWVDEARTTREFDIEDCRNLVVDGANDNFVCEKIARDGPQLAAPDTVLWQEEAKKRGLNAETCQQG